MPTVKPRFHIINGIRNNDLLRHSFNILAQKSFHIDFEKWFQAGCWDDHFRCYFVAENDTVVSNVSANLVTIHTRNSSHPALMLSTVMTEHSRRGQGFASELIRQILSDYPSRRFTYLFCNSDAYHFYTRLGFREIEMFRGIIHHPFQASAHPAQKQDMAEPTNFMRISQILQKQLLQYGVAGGMHVALWHCLYDMRDCLWYWPENETFAIAEIEDNELHLYGVFGAAASQWRKLLPQMCTAAVERVVLHFMPQNIDPDLHIESYLEPDTHLMVIGDNAFLPRWIYPEVFRA